MADNDIITKVFTTKKVTIYQSITLRNYADQGNYDLQILIDLNKHLGITKSSDQIGGKSIIVPVKSINIEPIAQMDASLIEPKMKKIRPYVREVLYQLRNFEISTRNLVNDVKTNQKILLPTHADMYLKSFSDIEKLFIKEEDGGYREYKKRIFREYYDSLQQLGIFHRNIIYLYHLSHNYTYCEFRQTDARKLRHALIYAHKCLIPCLGRLGEILNFISLNYRALTGRYGDHTLMQNITDISKGFFPLMNENFNSSGSITQKLDYTFHDVPVSDLSGESTVDSIGSFYSDDFVRHTSGRLNDRIRNNQEKINDEDLLSYGKDYTGLKDDSKINALRDDIDRNYKDNIEKANSEYGNRNKEATLQYYSYHIPEVKDFFTNLKRDMRKFKNQHKKFTRKFKPGKLDDLQDEAEKAINEAERTRSNSSYSTDAADKIDMMDARMEIYHLGVSIFCTAAIVNDEISRLQKLWMKEEDLIEQAERFYDKLVAASANPLSKEAREHLSEIYNSYQQFQDLYDDLMKSDRIFDTIVKVVVLVIAIAVIVVVTVFTGGAGAALSGSVGALGASLTTTQVVIVVATEAFAFAVAFEALSALVERRNISSVNVMSGFVTNLMFYGVFSWLGKFFTVNPGTAGLTRYSNTIRQLQLLKLQKAFMIPAKIATMTLATVVCSTPGFLYRIGMTYNRLPDAEEWVSFLTVNALIGGVFSTLAVSIEHLLPKIIQKYKAHQLKTNLQKLKTNLDEAGAAYKEVNSKYGTVIELDQNVFDDIMSKNEDLVSKLKTLNKGLKELRRELKKLQAELAKNYRMPDVNDFNELIVVDQTLDQTEALLRRAQYRQPPRRGLAVEIDNKIFGKGNSNCLYQMTFNKNLYIGRIPALLDKEEDIKTLLSNYTVQMGSKRYEGIEYDSTGSLSLVLRDKNTNEIVDAVTVLDEFGDGRTFTNALEVPLPDQTRPYEWFGNNPGMQITTILSEYIKLESNSFDDIMKMVNMNTRDMNHPLANMSEHTRHELRRTLRELGIKPKYAARIQKNYAGPGKQTLFGKGSITYVFDLLDLIDICSRKEAMINIGYGKDQLAGNADDMLYIFEITNQSLLMEPSNHSLSLAFEDMVNRCNAPKADLEKAGLDSHAIETVERFDDAYKKLVNLINSREPFPLSELGLQLKIRDLIEEVNSPPFTDTYGPETNYVLNDLNEPAKPGRIALMEQNMTKSELDRSLHYHILKILDSYFSTYPQYTNNGYTLTVLGNKGFGEYHMIVQYNSGAKTLRTGYIEKKDNSGKYYKIRDQIKE